MTPLTDEQRDLAGRYFPFARKLALRYKRKWRHLHDADFESAASLGLVAAARAFDPAKGVKFSTYARRRINGALIEEAERIYRLDLLGFHHEDLAGARSWVGHRLRPVGEDLELREVLERWLSRIPARRAAAIREVFLKGKTFDEAGRVLGTRGVWNLIYGHSRYEGGLSLLLAIARNDPAYAECAS